MKKIFIVAMLVVFMGCSLEDYYKDVYYSEILIQKTSLYYPSDYDPESIKNYYDIFLWIDARVSYNDSSPTEWPSVKKILSRGYGDCKAYSLVFLNLYYITFGVKGSLIFVNKNRTIVNGGKANHSIVKVDGILIDPQNGEIDNYSIKYRYGFGKLFK